MRGPTRHRAGRVSSPWAHGARPTLQDQIARLFKTLRLQYMSLSVLPLDRLEAIARPVVQCACAARVRSRVTTVLFGTETLRHGTRIVLPTWYIQANFKVCLIGCKWRMERTVTVSILFERESCGNKLNIGVIFSGGVILKNRGDGAVPTSSFHFDLKQTHS